MKVIAPRRPKVVKPKVESAGTTWYDKVFEVESFLNDQPKEILISFERYDRGAGEYLDTLFKLEWNHDLFHGPRTILVVNADTYVIETYKYFTPSDEEQIQLQEEARRVIETRGYYMSPYDDVFHHNTMHELFSAMIDENSRYQCRKQ